MKRFVMAALIILASGLNGQTKDPVKILAAVKAKFEKIRDYEVDLSIKVDVNFIKVPDTKTKVYFKQPDKVKVESAGFAMLPKNGANFSPSQLLKGDYTSLYIRQETIAGKKLDVIKIIPSSDTSEVILSTLWVDQESAVIRKVETTGKKNGTTTIELKYADNNSVLPSELKFSFNLGNIQIPAGMSGDQNEIDAKKPRAKGPVRGIVTLTYSDYKINKGIPDAFFIEKKK
jgi:outer membrane lipoprotein-sorting protein